MRSKRWQRARWVVSSVLGCWLCWAAVGGNDGAGNLLVFLAWLAAIAYTLSTFAPAKVSANIRKVGRPVPATLDHLVNLMQVAFLAWHGWFATAIAIGLAFVCQGAIYNMKDEEEGK